MTQMRDIERLLEADAANAQLMLGVFNDYSQELPDLLNGASELYATCCRAFGQTISEEFGGLPGDNATVGSIQVKLQRGLLLARIGVLYSTAIADFLRMRLTTPLASVRLQCESLALIKLMSDNPSIARQWMNIVSAKDGRQFFNQHQKGLKDILRRYNLAEVYDQTSGAALHSRFLGLARGFRTARRNHGNEITQLFTIVAQEFDGKNPDYFMTQVFWVLFIQARIFTSLKDAVPELTDPLLLETRLPNFVRRADQLFARFREVIQQRGAPFTN
jgi:hypothetical protein